jgi:hypothetical protein
VKESINTMSGLEDRIKELEALETRQMEALKFHAFETAESMRPSNLLKSALSEMVGSKSLKINALNASVGLGAGMLIKKIITYKSKGLLMKMAGFALQAVTTKLVSKNLPKFRQKINDL